MGVSWGQRPLELRKPRNCKARGCPVLPRALWPQARSAWTLPKLALPLNTAHQPCAPLPLTSTRPLLGPLHLTSSHTHNPPEEAAAFPLLCSHKGPAYSSLPSAIVLDPHSTAFSFITWPFTNCPDMTPQPSSTLGPVPWWHYRPFNLSVAKHLTSCPHSSRTTPGLALPVGWWL